jgi:hypothetical protein
VAHDIEMFSGLKLSTTICSEKRSHSTKHARTGKMQLLTFTLRLDLNHQVLRAFYARSFRGLHARRYILRKYGFTSRNFCISYSTVGNK